MEACATDVDPDLFKPPPLPDECSICMVPLPFDKSVSNFCRSCCGNIQCHRCFKEHKRVIDETNEKRMEYGWPLLEFRCPFCRELLPESNKEIFERTKRRMERNDANAFFDMAWHYLDGHFGLVVKKDVQKYLKLLQRAADLGSLDACHDLGLVYDDGEASSRAKTKMYPELATIASNKSKSRHYTELAAKGGHVIARHKLGIFEYRNGNFWLAMRHFRISAAGYRCSLVWAKKMEYMTGLISKGEYKEAKRAYNAHKRAQAALVLLEKERSKSKRAK